MYQIPTGPGWGEKFRITARPRLEPTEPRDQAVADSNLADLSKISGELHEKMSTTVVTLQGDVSEETGEAFEAARHLVGSFTVRAAIFMFHYKDGASDFDSEEFRVLQRHLKLAAKSINDLCLSVGQKKAFEQIPELDNNCKLVKK